MLCIELSGIVFNVPGQKKKRFFTNHFLGDISDEQLGAIVTHL